MTSQIPHFPPEIEALPDFDGPFDAHRLQSAGCDVLFATYPAGTTIAPHTHETNNVGVITKGQLILQVDGEVRTYGPGDWYHVPAGVEHAARFDTDSAEIEFWFSS
jgi:quercetin dioxygenase-like cupin family protein